MSTDATPTSRPKFTLLQARAAPWRGQALARRTELRGLLDAFLAHDPRHPDADALAAAVDHHLEAARMAVTGEGCNWFKRLIDWTRGAFPEQAAANLDKAELFLLRMAPQEYIIGQLPSLYSQVRTHLRPGDPRLDDMRRLVDRYVPPAPGEPARQTPLFAKLTSTDREAVAANFDAKASVARRDVSRVRSYRNILLMTAAALGCAVVVLTLITLKRPSLLPLCFVPSKTTVVGPTHTGPRGGGQNVGAEVPRAHLAERDDRVMRRTAARGDVALVELIGILAATVAAAVALRSMSGTTTPYTLPIALALLKVPTGALTAVLGIVLLRGEFIPGLSALDSSGQILAWAAVFGAAQQLVTRLVDEQAQGVLDKVGTPGAEKNAEGKTVPASGSSSA